MRTKHLFYTMALAGMFAACTNEEFADNGFQTATAERPSVAGVTLDMNEPSTRLGLTGDMKWNWEEGDKIAAMLMDQNNTGVRYGSATLTDDWNELTWLERYHLVDYVHTNYPFNYKNGEWATDANMLEGNYFLVYPYMSFNGQRQAYFDISKQKQVGNTGDARRKAYADNQHFIGYARLDATAGDTKLKAKMSELLAPVRINIESNCTNTDGEPLYVEKIVLEHPTFHSQYTVDPTTAAYPTVAGKDIAAKAWNLNPNGGRAHLNSDQNPTEHNDVTEHFNYANYVTATAIEDYKKDLYNHTLEGSELLADYVYNIKEGSVGKISDKWDEKPENNGRPDNKYYYDDAIRKVVKPLWKENWSENTTNYVEVYTYDKYVEDAEGNVVSSEPMLLKSGHAAQLGIIAMVPGFNDIESDSALKLYIYTNKGLVGPVSLKNQQDGNGRDAQVTDAILAADPRMDMQTTTVIIDDPDIVRVPNNKLINNTDDLKKYVQFLTNHSVDARIDITLTNDITIDDELAAAIKKMKEDKGVDNVAFYVSAPDNSKKYNVNIATTAANADILESLDLDDEILVEVVNGAVVDLTYKAHNYLTQLSMLNILVDNGGVLNITDPNNASVGGWGNTDIDKQFIAVNLENNGTVNLKSAVKNNAGIKLLNNKGTFNVEANSSIQLMTSSENKLNGVINVAATGILSATTSGNIANYGTINVSGELYNVKNFPATDNHVLPGRVVCEETAEVALATNKGKVIYNALPAAIEVLDNDYTTGVFEYTFTGAEKASDLYAKHVTDVFVKGTLTVDSDKNSTFRYVELNNGTLKKSDNPANTTLTFATPATGTVKNAAWNNSNVEMFKNENIVPAATERGMNQLVTKGISTIDGLTIKLQNTVNGQKGVRDVVIFNGEQVNLIEVTVNATEKEAANVKLNGVEVVVEPSTSTLGSLYIPKNKDVNSSIRAKVGAKLTATNTDPQHISWNKSGN